MHGPYYGAIVPQQHQIVSYGPTGKGKGKAAPVDFGIPGFEGALSEALKPVAEYCDIEDLKVKLGTKLVKASKTFQSDERAAVRGSATAAKALVEDFVHTCALAVSAGFYDKPWFGNINLIAPLLALAMYTFNGAKCFARVLTPMMERYIEDGLFSHAEEDRISKAIWLAVEVSGMKEGFQKKANKHLQVAYDEAHIKAPFGTTIADTAELGMLQDFVKGWMAEFVARGWDVLENGIISAGATTTRDEQVLLLTVLFQTLTDAGNAALPHQLTMLIQKPPESPWAFIPEVAQVVFQEMDLAAQQAEATKAAKRQQLHAYWDGVKGKGKWGHYW